MREEGVVREERDPERKPADEVGEAIASEARTVARGRASRTPFVALGAVGLAAWLLAGAITLLVFLLIWLL